MADRVPALPRTGGHAEERFRSLQIECQHYGYEPGVDRPEADQWTWPY